MEPISLIVAALIAGAAAATEETGKTVISDSYQGLKSLIKGKLSKEDEIEVIESAGANQHSKVSVARIINEHKLHELLEIVESAKNVLELIKNEHSMEGVYNTHIQGEVQGFIQGNNNMITLNFQNAIAQPTKPMPVSTSPMLTFTEPKKIKMDKDFNKRLYSEIGVFLEDFKILFEQFFYLVEIFDPEEETFYYIAVETLFKEPKGETKKVVDFFQSDEAKGDLNDSRHHTSRIYKKFDNNTLRRSDFGITPLRAYFDRNLNPTDSFIINKKKMLEYKLDEFISKDILYATFPIIGFNKIRGSAHILFEPNNKDYEKIVEGIFFTFTKLLTSTYENNYIVLNGSKFIDYKMLADEALNNYFLAELQYPKYYTAKIYNKKNVNKNSNHEVFISYSHKDIEYLNKLESHFAPLRHKVVFWDDRKIKPGQIWRDEIEDALKRATIAILILSSDFFNSDFIINNELPKLLSSASNQGLVILNVIVRPCMIEEYPAIGQYQAVNDPKFSILQLDEASREVIWVKLARHIKYIIENNSVN